MLLATILAVAIGVSLGLLGGGGSILTVPILLYVVGLEAKPAIASSLLIVGVTSAAAMLVHARAGRVRWKTGLTFGAASMLGAYLGGRVAHYVAGGLLLGTFTVVMVVTAVMMMRKRGEPKAVTPSLVRTLGIGLGAGGLTGVVGAGGGFIVVPALAMLGGLPIAEAVATSLLVIALNSFAGFAGYVRYVPIDVHVAVQLTVAAVVGSFLGATVSRKVKPDALRKGFAWFVLAMAGFMAFKQLRPQVHLLAAASFPDFTPWTSLAGGAIIGLSVTLLLLLNGRIAGISGIVGGLLKPREGDFSWRALFVLGLLLGGVALALLRPTAIGQPSVPLGYVAVAGLFVGFGTRLGNGCTSGHGICGISRFSVRSLVATATFMTTGALAVFVMRNLGVLR